LLLPLLPFVDGHGMLLAVPFQFHAPSSSWVCALCSLLGKHAQVHRHSYAVAPLSAPLRGPHVSFSISNKVLEWDPLLPEYFTPIHWGSTALIMGGEKRATHHLETATVSVVSHPNAHHNKHCHTPSHAPCAGPVRGQYCMNNLPALPATCN
jgi:hypothetical protein